MAFLPLRGFPTNFAEPMQDHPKADFRHHFLFGATGVANAPQAATKLLWLERMAFAATKKEPQVDKCLGRLGSPFQQVAEINVRLCGLGARMYGLVLSDSR